MTMRPFDVDTSREWMRYLIVLILFDVFSTTLLLWGGAGAGAATEANPFMAYIVRQPFLHLVLKLMFALFTFVVAIIMERNFKGVGTRIVQVACIPYMVAFMVNFFWILYSDKLRILAL